MLLHKTYKITKFSHIQFGLSYRSLLLHHQVLTRSLKTPHLFYDGQQSNQGTHLLEFPHFKDISSSKKALYHKSKNPPKLSLIKESVLLMFCQYKRSMGFSQKGIYLLSSLQVQNRQ